MKDWEKLLEIFRIEMQRKKGKILLVFRRDTPDSFFFSSSIVDY